jgi:poly-gamma-glutamate synthesis protein (capsule biosynthesis protein)
MNDLLIHAVGDVGPRRADLASIFAHTPDLARCDLLFGQMETVVTDHLRAAPNAKLALRSPPEAAAILATAGFAAVSIAGNHAMDYGARGLFDTMRHLKAAGVAPCGGGASIAEARAPAMLKRKGRRVAFLAYSSILPAGFAAEGNKPGCAPMWAHTHYDQIEPDQPGSGARIRTFADPAQLKALLDDVRAAKRQAEIVAVSFHWGIHFTRAVLADYQREVACAAIDAGADMIIGHHPHILKAVEIYRGKPIFYSLGNFALEQPSAYKEDVHLDAAFKDVSALGGKWSPGKPYMIPPDTRFTMIARIAVDADGAVTTRLQLHWIDDASTPHALKADDPRFAEVEMYLREVTAEAGVGAQFQRDGDEIVVTA